ncbi:MAG: SH3 domain-containing protein, partial [Lachnospiraceae bacterium]|nr:SH3 domain-containing protein [Lachnospiraceae bacterium]
ETATASQFGLNAINAVYYVATDELNVRTGCSVDDHAIGVLYRNEKVTVNGAVTKDGADYGWYQIQYMGGTAYVSASFLSSSPSEAPSKADIYATGSGVDVYRSNGNYLCMLVPYSDGRYYREDTMTAYENFLDGIFFGEGDYAYTYDALTRSSSSASTERVQCEYCGEWFDAGADYRNHVAAAHSGSSTGTGEDLVQCEYCGEWFEAGNDYRNHVMAAHSQSSTGTGTDKVQCEYCGEWFEAGNDYRNHVMAAHSGN